MFKKSVLTAATCVFGFAAVPALADTLEDVRDNGFVECGIAGDTPGFSARDANGQWSGLEVDYCRAIAAAIFNNPDAVRYTQLNAGERFAALTSGTIDVLARTTTWTMSRDTSLEINFAGILFYDGQGFMVRRDADIGSALDLSGRAICIEAGTTTELNAEDYFLTNNMEFNPVTFVDQAAVFTAYLDGRCDVYTADSSALAAARTRAPNPDDHVILPEVISKEPLGPAVREGDDRWFNIVRWVYFALLNAEELGVTRDNVDEMLGADNPAIKRLLGVEGDFGAPMGLDKDWAYNIIKHLGNYGEIFDRHVGPDTPVGLERGLNALWTDGGIQYPPPIR